MAGEGELLEFYGSKYEGPDQDSHLSLAPYGDNSQAHVHSMARQSNDSLPQVISGFLESESGAEEEQADSTPTVSSVQVTKPKGMRHMFGRTLSLKR